MSEYSKQKEKINLEKLRDVLKELPPFCFEFFHGIESTTSSLTRLAYAYDLRLFFNYLTENVAKFSNYTQESYTLSDLDSISTTQLEMFMDYLNLYYKEENEIENHEKGKARKISTLRSFYKYFYRKEKLKNNPAALVNMPKIHEKPITRLEIDEVARILDIAESGENLTTTQQRYHKYTQRRDVAILTLFLTTGIRISELVGINISDLDFNVNGFKITRKGGNEVVLYFGDETRAALLDYLNERDEFKPLPGFEDALFLSLQSKRISSRSVQNIVEKFAKIVSPLKKISPHKLRSTYGTMLYRETGDIYLVAEVLGHKDVNTTKKHYAAMSDEKRRLAAQVIKLRDDE